MIRFIPIPTDTVRAYRAGALDANGLAPERKLAEDSGYPCRHCMTCTPAGREVLVLAHRPFDTIQPYSEVGPIFLCADACPSGQGTSLPAFLTSEHYIVRGYGADERIVYGTGGVVATSQIPARAEALLKNQAVSFVHLRSASNNCYHCRIERA